MAHSASARLLSRRFSRTLRPVMARYFIEVAYKGTAFSGFQIQENSRTVQGDLDQALGLVLREAVHSTGGSRTDAGVHARQNFLHFDTETPVCETLRYKLNAILGPELAVKGIYPVHPDAHARFSATERCYRYFLHPSKDPFLQDVSYFYPYPLDLARLRACADLLCGRKDFRSFAKRNTQVRTFMCEIREARWLEHEGRLEFRVRGNRFLRGMVRGLVGTMLRAGRGQMSPEAFRDILESGDMRRADFSVPGHGLTLWEVGYPQDLFVHA